MTSPRCLCIHDCVCHLLQLLNNWTHLREVWYEHYGIGDHINLTFLDSKRF
jgi:hypothetical protein